MADNIDYLLQDSAALILTVDNNREAMNAKGFKESSYTALTNARQNLSTKETAQQKAIELAEKKTAEQNQLLNSTRQLIQNVKNAAKSAYGKDEAILRSFKVGEEVPKTVAKLSTTCKFISAVTLEHHDALIENGLTEEDIDKVHSASGNLTATDSVQENSKKIKSSATVARDNAAADLKDKMFRVRNFAKTCFAGNKEILLQFKPIPKGKGGSSGGEETPPETPPKE